jgi:CubicO group peptidase (beta-lactamase class C family)
MSLKDARAIATTLALLLPAACAGEPPPPPVPPPPAVPTPVATVAAPPAPPPPEVLTADAPRATKDGATFTAPKGWTIKSDTGQLLLDGPEPDIHVAIVDLKAANADAAIAAAWPTLHPNFTRAIKVALDRPARHGWEQQRRVLYETSANERLVVYATAYRNGPGYTVLLVEASDPAFERRGAQVRLVTDSLRPAGYQRETFKGKVAHSIDEGRRQAIKGLVDSSRTIAGIPGVAVSLFTSDTVLWEGGFGVKELGKPAPVDADTLFIVASNTKGMSTLLLAKLVDQGKLTWDTPVTQLDPSFKLGNADTTSKVLVKHLVCACTGLPRQDFEWLFEFKGATPQTEMTLLGTMQPTTKFGEIFQYSNILASAAGFIGGHVLYPDKELGAAYDEAMNSQVFGPLGMKSTTFDFARALAGNHATGHSEDVDGKPAIATMDINRAVIPLRPAGGAWSSVRDMRRYVQMELMKGKLPDGNRYVSEKALLARRAPQVAEGEDETYGMGLSVNTEYGVAYVHHGGSMIGFKSDIFWLPDYDLGGVVLANADSGGLILRPFIRKTLEAVFDGSPEATEDLASGAKQRKERLAQERTRLVVPADPAVVATLAKRYVSPALGEIAMTTGPKGTVFDFGEWKSPVATRKNDDGTMSMTTIGPGVDGFEFVVGQKDGKRTLTIRDMQHEYVFTEG